MYQKFVFMPQKIVEALHALRKEFFPTRKELLEQLVRVRYRLGQEEMRFTPNLRVRLREEEAYLKKKLQRFGLA